MKQDRRFDLIVIGAGMAGVAAANKCGAQGWRVGIVDALPYGGTCALRGCDPKKILRRGAEIVDSVRLMSGKGIDGDGLSINWADLMKHKHGFTDPVPRKMEEGLSSNGVKTLHGHARRRTASSSPPEPGPAPSTSPATSTSSTAPISWTSTSCRRGSSSSAAASSRSSSPTSPLAPGRPR
jgi:hypothetical protein